MQAKAKREWFTKSLTLSTLGKIFSRQHLEIFFLIFPRKQDLTFHANCLQGDNLHEMSDPVYAKNKKNIINLSSAENAQRVVKVKCLHPSSFTMLYYMLVIP